MTAELAEKINDLKGIDKQIVFKAEVYINAN